MKIKKDVRNQRHGFHKKVVLVGGMLACAWVHPQPTPGDISRQVEPARASVVPAVEAVDIAAPRPTAVEPGATTVRVRQWVLEGNTLLAQAQVDWLLRNFTNVDISLKQINEAAAWVQRAYEEDGWLARVVLPQQDVTNGVVRMQVLEAQLGAVILDEQGASHVSPEVVQAVVNHALTPGAALNTHRVNRGLLLADDLSGVSVTGQLKSGQAEGSTDVLVPAGLHESLKHIWRQNDAEVLRLEPRLEHLDQGQVRLRSSLDGEQLPPERAGRWSLDVETASGQLVGRVRFEVVD